MDAASILVLVLTGGVVALLIWFEVNSRRNDARDKTSAPMSVNSDTPQKGQRASDSRKQRAA
jgi:hypothetical protein